MKFVLMVREHPEVIPLIEEMIKDKQKLNEINEKGCSALMIACRNSNTYSNNLVVKMLIDAGADVNIMSTRNSTTLMVTCGRPIAISDTALIIACTYSNMDSNIETVEMLINAGSNTDNVNHNGCTALMLAIIYHSYNKNHLEVIRMLINAITDIHAKDKAGDTALMCACKYSNTEIIKILINAGANINTTNTMEDTVLGYACRNNNMEAIKIFVDARINVNAKNNSGHTALIITNMYHNVLRDDLETMRILIKAGSDVNNKTTSGYTALFFAMYDVNIEKFLIYAGADVNVKYSKGKTFLMLLLSKDDVNTNMIIELLYKSRITLLDTDDNGKSAYDYYIEKGHHVLDEYHLKILKGDINPNNTKSARVN